MICGFRSVLCVSVFQGSLVVIVIMIDGSEKRNYNIAEWNRALWLANTPDPFTSGLHADVSLFTFLRQSLFFLLDIASFYLKAYSVAKIIETSNASSRHDDVELPNFDLDLFGELPSKSVKRFANLSERELNHMVEQRRSEKTKKTTNWSVSTFRGKPPIVTIRQCFPAYCDIQPNC